MSHARTTAEQIPRTFQPGDRVRIINKRSEPEPEADIVIHDTSRMLVLVDVFLPTRGSTRWWIPDYMCKLIQNAKVQHDAGSA